MIFVNTQTVFIQRKYRRVSNNTYINTWNVFVPSSQRVYPTLWSMTHNNCTLFKKVMKYNYRWIFYGYEASIPRAGLDQFCFLPLTSSSCCHYYRVNYFEEVKEFFVSFFNFLTLQCLSHGITITRTPKNTPHTAALYPSTSSPSLNLVSFRLPGMNSWMRLWRKVMVIIERGVPAYMHWNGNTGNICITSGLKGLLVGCMARRYHPWSWHRRIWIIHKKMLFYGTKLLAKYRKIRIDLTVLKVLSLGGRGWRNESVPLITMALRDWITLVSLRWISVRRRLCSTTLIIRILSWIHT